MTNFVEAVEIPKYSRYVVSLDGTGYDLELGKDKKIHINNIGNETLSLSWLNNVDSSLQIPLFTCITDLLSTHSKQYALTTSRSARYITNSTNVFKKFPIDLAALSSWVSMETKKSYMGFLRPLLRRLLELDPELFDREAAGYLQGNIKWEQSDSSYFSLMTNCPEGGALTDQELHSLHSALNRSYAKDEINQLDYTLVWMMIGTGLRPIQIARMRRSDVQIHDGPEGKEVMLNVPLAKGEGENTGEYWLRRAPSVLAEALISYLNCNQGNPQDPLFLKTSSEVSRRTVAACSKLDSWSERLGTKIPI